MHGPPDVPYCVVVLHQYHLLLRRLLLLPLLLLLMTIQLISASSTFDAAFGASGASSV